AFFVVAYRVVGVLYCHALVLLAGELVERVEPLERLARDRPVLDVLELHVLRRLGFGGGFRHLAVGRGASGRLVRDHAVGRAALGGRNLPLIGGGLDEHLARRRAAPPHVLMRGADAAAAAR